MACLSICRKAPQVFRRGQLAKEKSASAAQRQRTWRDVGLGAQILRDLNVQSMRLISTSDRHYVGLGGFGIEIKETIKIGA